MEGSYHPERNAPLFPLLMWATPDKIVSLRLSLLPSRSQLAPKATGVQRVSECF